MRQQGWQNRGQSCRQHAFARPRWSVEQKIMATRCGNFQSPSGRVLSFDIGEIGQARSLLPDGGFGPAHHLRAFEMIGQLQQRGRGKDRQITGRPSGFRPAGFGTDQTEIVLVRGDGCGQNTGHGGDRSVQRQFPHDHKRIQSIGGNSANRRHNRQCDRQIIMAPFFR